MNLEDMVYSNYGQLNETDKIIWNFIANHKKDCRNISINDLARQCSVSRATITRFVKKVQLKSFSELKLLLSWEDEKGYFIEENSYMLACQSIINYVEEQKNKNYDKVCQYLYEAERIFVYGSGDMQRAVAKQMKRMFLSSEEIIYDFEGRTFDHSFYQVVTPRDVVILISLSGNNRRILEIANRLKMLNVKIISITELKSNELYTMSDASLYVSATNLNILKNHPQYQITTLFFIIVELLFIKFCLYKKQRMLREGKDISTF